VGELGVRKKKTIYGQAVDSAFWQQAIADLNYSRIVPPGRIVTQQYWCSSGRWQQISEICDSRTRIHSKPAVDECRIPDF